MLKQKFVDANVNSNNNASQLSVCFAVQTVKQKLLIEMFGNQNNYVSQTKVC